MPTSRQVSVYGLTWHPCLADARHVTSNVFADNYLIRMHTILGSNPSGLEANAITILVLTGTMYSVGLEYASK